MPYVEIKDTSPDAEKFEAMAGIPTTQNLYAGFGGTEFIVNMEVERLDSSGERVYSLTYTCSNCIETDEECIISKTTHGCTNSECPTCLIHEHDDACYVEGVDGEGNPTTGPCVPTPNKPGPCTGSSQCGESCSCCGKSASENGCPGDIHPCGHSTGDVGIGCQYAQKINNKHPHSHTWKGKVTQPIESFDYTKITGLELWQTNNLVLKGNPELFSNPNLNINPNTGYRTFHTQEEYEAKNGRLVFSFNYNPSDEYGNTKTEETNGTLMLKTECDEAATEWMNQQLAGKMVDATVISDFLTLNTSEGYQTPMYHQYKSDSVPIATATFSTGDESKSIEGDPITFSTIPTWEEMWQDNTSTASQWEPGHVTRSGYNGKFSVPQFKYDNTNVTTPTDPSLRNLKPNHPNTTTVSGDLNFVKSVQNQRMTIKGINIIDSTTPDRKWSESDGIEPVPNGLHDTGGCFIEMGKIINYKTTEGNKWEEDEVWGTPNDDGGNANLLRKQVTYSPLHNDVNDIVVHNPVSVQDVTIISNDKKYDLRTESSLAEGGDPEVEDSSACPLDASCEYSKLSCTVAASAHTGECYVEIEAGSTHTGLNTHEHTTECTQASGWYWLHGSGCTYEGETHISTTTDQCSQCTHTCGQIGATVSSCTNAMNAHACGPMCVTGYQKVLICDDPHHFMPGAPWDPQNPKNHYDFGDPRCYTACGDDSRHKKAGNVIMPDGQPAVPSDLFINIDREFQLYYPSTGDFAQQPDMHGISECTSIRGMGYYDRMDTAAWIREKYAVLPVNVIAEDGKGYKAGDPIDLLGIHESPMYKFYAVLANEEQVNSQVQYVTIANNAREDKYYTDNDAVTNRTRYFNTYAARHTAAKLQYIDVVGYIGGLTINDTGDFRFATLFKQLDPKGGWLIENLVPKVLYKLPNKVVCDYTDVRQEKATGATSYQDTYGTLFATIGGKAHPFVPLPLTPGKNPITALHNQPMRPGYQLYMDVGTVGNYYGENWDNINTALDFSLYYKLQATPRYWNLNLETGKYTPVDVYMGVRGEYKSVVKFGSEADSEYLYYLDWLEESARRNYTTAEKSTTGDVLARYSIKFPATSTEYGDYPAIERVIRMPKPVPDPIGSATRLFLNDINRTFIGSEETYGKNKNPQRIFDQHFYQRQAQRWHFTLGLPSSSVFVPAGSPCTDGNMKWIQEQDSVIVCTLDIKAKGTVWTLQYDGTGINGHGIVIDGKRYDPPTEPDTGTVIDDPIVVIYSNKMTAKNDLRTEGSH